LKPGWPDVGGEHLKHRRHLRPFRTFGADFRKQITIDRRLRERDRSSEQQGRADGMCFHGILGPAEAGHYGGVSRLSSLRTIT
jgi:hypothetical protein